MSLFQNVSGSGKDMGQAYVNFARNAMDQIRSKITDELWILTFFEVCILTVKVFSQVKYCSLILNEFSFRAFSNGTRNKFKFCATGSRRDWITLSTCTSASVFPSSSR